MASIGEIATSLTTDISDRGRGDTQPRQPASTPKIVVARAFGTIIE